MLVWILYVILLIYTVGMIFISRLKQTPKDEAESIERDIPLPTLSAKKAMKRFAIAALIILISGTLLTIIGTELPS
ncbi:hypothetical protein KHA80_01015 [Anaerobacillus sp. HL2]|nr:hypothetical protein KHA80_01015 [Anaerobacillus sp. HL2]